MPEHAPGWYEHGGERRYWDGVRWTHAESIQPAPPPQAGPAPPPAQLPPPHPQGGAGPQGWQGGIPLPRKEPALPLIISFFIPGVGSMMNGDTEAGIGFLLLYIVGLGLLLCLGWILIGLIGLPMMFVAMGWSMYHAYQGAVAYNRSIGYPE